DTLGGRPGQPSVYDDNGRVNYERVRKTANFKKGLDRLIAELENFAIAILCSEEDPLDCHRGLMITPALLERGVSPAHIRKDGSLESTPEMETRLLTETKVGVGVFDGLFAGEISPQERQEFLAQAYRHMAQRKAFRLRPDEE